MVHQGVLILFSLRFCFLISFFFVTSSTFEKKTPKFEGALKVNSMLTKTKRLFEGKVFGPESMAVDSKGKYNCYGFSSVLYVVCYHIWFAHAHA